MPLKGDRVQVFENATTAGHSDFPIDMRDYNAIQIDAFISVPAGVTPEAQLVVFGTAEGGASGRLGVPSRPAEILPLGSSSISYDVSIGARWIRLQLAIATTGARYTVWVTPYVSAGPNIIRQPPAYVNYYAAVVATVQVLAGPNVLLGIHALNDHATQVAYLQIFNAAAAGDVTLGTTEPLLQYRLPAATSREVAFPRDGARLMRGLAFAASTARNGSTAPTGPIDITFLRDSP